jgi:hypothetical protein
MHMLPAVSLGIYVMQVLDSFSAVSAIEQSLPVTWTFDVVHLREANRRIQNITSALFSHYQGTGDLNVLYCAARLARVHVEISQTRDTAQHPNSVTLLGDILVAEHERVFKPTALDRAIHLYEKALSNTDDWNRRVQAEIGLARALAYTFRTSGSIDCIIRAIRILEVTIDQP